MVTKQSIPKRPYNIELYRFGGWGTWRFYNLKLLLTLKSLHTLQTWLLTLHTRCRLSNSLHIYCNTTLHAPTSLHTLKPRCTRSNLAARAPILLHTLQITAHAHFNLKSAVYPCNRYNSMLYNIRFLIVDKSIKFQVLIYWVF